MTPSRALVAALLGGALLTACTAGGEPEPDRAAGSGPATAEVTAGPTPVPTEPAPSGASPVAPPASAPASSSAAPDAAPDTGSVPAPPFPADTSVDTEEPSGALQTVVAVRAARQAGFDRVVFELRGKDGEVGSPGWRVEYVETAVQDGSGDEVEVAGAETLQVFLEGVALPFDTGQEEASADLVPGDTSVVREVDLSGTFEGRFTAFVGLDRRLPFRVYRLSGPSRVVVEVRHR